MVLLPKLLSISHSSKFGNLNIFRLITQINRCISLQAYRSMKAHSIVAVVQLNSSHDVEENWKVIKEAMLESKASMPAVKMFFLPEGFDYIGRNKEETMKQAFTEDGEYIGRYRQIAKDLNVWLSLGGFHEKSNEERSYNTHVIIGSDGLTKCKYRKLHLFDLDIPNKIRVKETDFSVPGGAVEMPIETPIGRLGLSTCYDLRFPHLASQLRASGADILTYPSAFTVATGMDHWEVLLRSQAITNQCYVIAAAQTGKHNEKRSSFGHSMVIDPWGAVVAQCSEGAPLVAFASIDLQYIQKVRRDLPCFEHRRLDIYDAPPVHQTLLDPDLSQTYAFANLTIPSRHVFLLSHLSYAFVNIKPILPGHVLVSPRRKVEKFTNLTDAECSDLFRCVKLVESGLEKFYGVTSTSISLQDGPAAGQSVEHVHVHVIPRQATNDIGDKIYAALATHDKDTSGRRRPDEMQQEATKFRSLFY